MVTVSRRLLRQHLGQQLLRDTVVGTNTASLGPGAASAWFIDASLVDASASGNVVYQRTWIRHNGQTFRVASFNSPSGAFVSNQTAASGVLSGSEYELHELLSPEDKNLAIDWAINRIWIRQEVALNTVDGLTQYSVGYDFGQIFDWYVWLSPTGTTGRTKAIFQGQRPEIRLTGSGREIRLSGALGASQQLVLDAEVRASLGAADTATINLPNEEHILYGAEAQCWEMLAKRAPQVERRSYIINAQRAAAAYSRLSHRFSAQRDVAPRFRNPVPNADWVPW